MDGRRESQYADTWICLGYKSNNLWSCLVQWDWIRPPQLKKETYVCHADCKERDRTNSNNTRRSREREENITRGYIFPGVWSQQTSRNIKQPNTWGMRQFKQPIWYAKGLLPNGIDEHSTTLEVRVWMKTKGNAKAEMRWAMTHVGTIAQWKLAYDQLSNRVLLVRYEQTKLWLLSYDRAWTNMHRISSC